MTGRNNQSGFTLVEVLISVFALALLMTTGGVMLNSALAGQAAVEARSESLRELQITRAHLSADIGNALARGTRIQDGGNDRQSFFGGRANRDGAILGLVRGGWTNVGGEQARSELVTVEYELEDNNLMRRVWLRPDRSRFTPAFEEPIMTGVRTIDVSFFAAGEPANEWAYAELDEVPILPDAVTLRITLENGNVSVQKFLVGRNS